MLKAPKAVTEAETKMSEEMKAEQARVKEILFDGVNFSDEEANAEIAAYNETAKASGFSAASVSTREMVPAWQIKR